MNSKSNLEKALKFSNGSILKNKFMLAPLTNTQSHEDGKLSDDELHWLTMRAKGNFGLVMTCASHVQSIGKGFPGQLGIFSDDHISGHQKLTQQIKSYGALAVVQLHHAGMRSPKELIYQNPVCPSLNKEHNTRALTTEEVEILKIDFINAAVRAQKSGYDGVEIHGAHGYIIAQFISDEINLRTDKYGGTLQNRCRLLFEIIDGIRTVCGKEFLLGVRLSPERFGMKLSEVKKICETLNQEAKIDFLDISLWDIYKYPEEETHNHKKLLHHFTDMNLNNVRLTVAGKIRNAEDVLYVLKNGVDFATIGMAAILHHDFPNKVIDNLAFKATALPVTESYLKLEGVSPKFMEYLKKWPSIVK